ncbi:Histone-fold [Artemisia annua]|uniref:Histone-fold n=1 Tax=Artemisia annua TaxID=35608 RepID=A0A2U1M2F6_ARTAN|nr:Histone-fold [Artemisia annua]
MGLSAYQHHWLYNQMMVYLHLRKLHNRYLELQEAQARIKYLEDERAEEANECSFAGGEAANLATCLVRNSIANEQFEEQLKATHLQHSQIAEKERITFRSCDTCFSQWSQVLEELRKLINWLAEEEPNDRVRLIFCCHTQEGLVEHLFSGSNITKSNSFEKIKGTVCHHAFNALDAVPMTLAENSAAITRTDIFDLLVDIFPREDIKEEVMTSIPTVNVPVGGPSNTYSYMAPQHSLQSGSPGLISNKPMMDPGLYAQQPPL